MKTELNTFQKKHNDLSLLIFETERQRFGVEQYIDTAGLSKNGVEGVLRLWDVDEMGIYLVTFNVTLDRKISFEFFEETDVEKVANVVLKRITSHIY